VKVLLFSSESTMGHQIPR